LQPGLLDGAVGQWKLLSGNSTLRIESISEKRARQPLQKLHFLYHELRKNGCDYPYALETKEFKKQVDLFLQVRKAESPGLRPEVTFDDGHISDFDYALPILLTQGLTARFFITVGWTGKKPGYMGWRELRSLHDSGQPIGAHGWSHAFLTHCAPKDLDVELVKARSILEDKLGTSITTMSVPGGRYNRRVLAACRDAGYTQVYTSVPGVEPEPLGFTVGRLNVRGDWSLAWIWNVLQPGSRVLSNLERQYRIKAIAKTVAGDWLYEKLWAPLNRKEPVGGDGGDYRE
jgi:peptidoglycan/xylan/chitin deacetylase (PgdA/CDA1 family)